MTQPFGTFRPTPPASWLISATRHSFLRRGSPRKLIVKLISGMIDKPVDIEFFGKNARLYFEANNSERKAILMGRKFEPNATNFIHDHLPNKNAVFVDIGANAGIVSLAAASFFTTGRLIAVEPQPELFSRLETNLAALNPDIPASIELQLCQCALGSESGEMSLSLADEAGRASFAAEVGSEHMVVKVRTLLDVLNERETKHVDVMKIDIEGFEDRVLIPFLDTAPQTLLPKAIILEHCHSSRWEDNCLEVLERHNYAIQFQDSANSYLVLAA